jgi:hypothetical protein
MKHSSQKRTTEFHWKTKQDLYDYFRRGHGATQQMIDREIDAAMHSFRERKGETINTQQLWEKVGRTLARKLNDHVILASIASDTRPGAAPSHDPREAALYKKVAELTSRRPPRVARPEPHAAQPEHVDSDHFEVYVPE